MPTLSQALETLKYKIHKFGPDAHCTEIIVSEESRASAIANKPDAEGRQHTRISFETYSARSYSAWHECFEYLIERCGFNPIIVCDLILLLVQEAQKPSGIEAMDGLDIALHGLFKVNDYPEELRKAKTERRNRRSNAAKTEKG